MADPVAAALGILPVDVQGRSGVRVRRNRLLREVVLDYADLPAGAVVPAEAFVAIQDGEGGMLKVPAASFGGDGEGGPPSGTASGAANGAVPILRVLRFDGVGLSLASADNVDHAEGAVGVSYTAAASGALVFYRFAGPMSSASFDFDPGPVWLGKTGQMTQTYPEGDGAKFVLQVGVVSSTKILNVGLQPPVYLTA